MQQFEGTLAYLHTCHPIREVFGYSHQSSLSQLTALVPGRTGIDFDDTGKIKASKLLLLFGRISGMYFKNLIQIRPQVRERTGG